MLAYKFLGKLSINEIFRVAVYEAIWFRIHLFAELMRAKTSFCINFEINWFDYGVRKQKLDRQRHSLDYFKLNGFLIRGKRVWGLV